MLEGPAATKARDRTARTAPTSRGLSWLRSSTTTSPRLPGRSGPSTASPNALARLDSCTKDSSRIWAQGWSALRRGHDSKRGRLRLAGRAHMIANCGAVVPKTLHRASWKHSQPVQRVCTATSQGNRTKSTAPSPCRPSRHPARVRACVGAPAPCRAAPLPRAPPGHAPARRRLCRRRCLRPWAVRRSTAWGGGRAGGVFMRGAVSRGAQSAGCNL